MMKYGDAENKATALALMREFSKKGKDNKNADSSPEETVSIPFTIPSSTTTDGGPGTGELIATHGLTWAHRLCNKVFHSDACLNSPNGFSLVDVFAKINGRICLSQVVDICVFSYVRVCYIYKNC